MEQHSFSGWLFGRLVEFNRPSVDGASILEELNSRSSKVLDRRNSTWNGRSRQLLLGRVLFGVYITSSQENNNGRQWPSWLVQIRTADTAQEEKRRLSVCKTSTRRWPKTRWNWPATKKNTKPAQKRRESKKSKDCWPDVLHVSWTVSGGQVRWPVEKESHAPMKKDAGQEIDGCSVANCWKKRRTRQVPSVWNGRNQRHGRRHARRQHLHTHTHTLASHTRPAFTHIGRHTHARQS